VTGRPGKPHAGDGLEHHGARGEQEIGKDDGARNARDLVRIAAQMRHQHEEGDARAGAEQHRRADHVHGLEDEIQHQRSSRIAIATRFSTSTGQILSIGPSGSAQSRGTRMVPITA
jgi:hypothetical protein